MTDEGQVADGLARGWFTGGPAGSRCPALVILRNALEGEIVVPATMAESTVEGELNAALYAGARWVQAGHSDFRAPCRRHYGGAVTVGAPNL